MISPNIEARNVSVNFVDGDGRDVSAIDIDRFAVEPTSMLCVTGPSGSGKSTLLYALAGLLKPTKGEVLWDNSDIYTLSKSGRARLRLDNAGFIFQNIHLVPELSPLANILLPATFKYFKPPKTIIDRALALIEQFSIPNRQRAGHLSLGEQQRTALARALLLQPKILFADEPTANLDLEATQVVIDSLKAAQKQGMSVIVVSHDPLVINSIQRKVNLLRGQIVN